MKQFKCLMTIILAMAFPLSNIHAQSEKEKAMTRTAEQFISQMTIDEKISQLMNEAPGIERLGLKPYNWWSESLHGVGRDGRATVFPQPICMGATFDEPLIKEIGCAIGTEGRAKYIIAQQLKNYSQYAGLTFWAPNVNIFRDPRWGRGMETYGEDPFLTGTLGTAYVKGMQGDDPFYLRVGACGKHFAVHSGPESTRHTADVKPSYRDLYETYLPQFKMLVQQGHVETIMGAYNSLYGESCSGSKFLLTDILRKQWGFRGHIVSDCGAVTDIHSGHHIAKTEAEAAAIAIKAGLNLECGSTFKALKDALNQHLITEKDLDKALLPLMMTRLKLGILQPDNACPYNQVSETEICSPAHTALSLRAAKEGMVLLKNDNVLPLDKKAHTIFVAGPGASDAFDLMGNYFGLSNHYSTYLEGIMNKVSNGTSVNYHKGFVLNGTKESRNSGAWEGKYADISILVMGNDGNTEGEEGDAIESDANGDRNHITLPESQMEYLREVSKDHKGHLVVILTGGSPIDVREISQLADAVVMAWYPGQEGGEALADLLFGDANFSGRLPITFPESVDVLPAFDDYSMQGRTYKYMKHGVMYPFGYGLSYSHVQYANAVATVAARKDAPLHVEAQLTNTGKLAVDEVAQVYLQTPTAGISSPQSSLVAFRRVHLEPQQSTTVDFDVAAEQLKTIQADGSARLLKGRYHVVVGGAAPMERTKELGISTTTADFDL
jgi:beta-glucosidase